MCSMFYRKGTSLMSLLWQESLCKLNCNISFISIHFLKELGRFVDDFADQLLLIYAVSHLLQTKNQTSITWVLLHWRIWQGNADCSFFSCIGGGDHIAIVLVLKTCISTVPCLSSAKLQLLLGHVETTETTYFCWRKLCLILVSNLFTPPQNR